MKFQATDIATLLLKKISGQLTSEEAATLEEWKNASAANLREYEDLLQLTVVKSELTHYRDAQAVGKRLTIPTTSPHTRRNPFLRWYWAAASVFLLLGLGAYLWYQDSSRPQALTSENKHLPKDILPGRDGAILTLADGRQVVLDSLGNELIAMQSGTQVVLKDGQLSYDPTGSISGEAAYNTMSTPKGRQFNLLLPDGTRVWLNAASSIRYPTTFVGTERKVEILGEAYFEVVKNTNMPFRVNVNNRAEVEVLGTSFNVNAYEDEANISATLLEGSVKVAAFQVVSSDRPVTLKPRQQAQIMQAGQNTRPGIKVINDADIDKVMAWKNGAFNFTDVSLKDVMKQLERWYDIEVIYESTVPNVELTGKMTRDVTLNDLLKNLGDLGVHCKLEGRKVVVLP
ncbi:MAG TPA: FecR domain-containing protein [Flavitalea sp.]|nr:FecR domain-containing protein [Flavitalea sp.]